MSASDPDQILKYGPMGHDNVPVRAFFSHLEGILIYPQDYQRDEFYSNRYWAEPFTEENAFFGTYYIATDPNAEPFPFYYAHSYSLLKSLEEQSDDETTFKNVAQRWPEYSSNNLPTYVNPEDPEETGKKTPYVGRHFWEDSKIKGALTWGNQLYHKGFILVDVLTEHAEERFRINSAAFLRTFVPDEENPGEEIEKIWLLYSLQISESSLEVGAVKEDWYAEEVTFKGEIVVLTSPRNSISLGTFIYWQDYPSGSGTYLGIINPDAHPYYYEDGAGVGVYPNPLGAINASCTEALIGAYQTEIVFDENGNAGSRLLDTFMRYSIGSTPEGVPIVELKITTELFYKERDDDDSSTEYNDLYKLQYSGDAEYIGIVKRTSRDRYGARLFEAGFYINDEAVPDLSVESTTRYSDGVTDNRGTGYLLRHIDLVTQDYGIIKDTYKIRDPSDDPERVFRTVSSSELWVMVGDPTQLWTDRASSTTDENQVPIYAGITYQGDQEKYIIELKSESGRGDSILVWSIAYQIHDLRKLLYKLKDSIEFKTWYNPEDLLDRLNIPDVPGRVIRIMGKI